jgi:citrate synthase
MSDMHHYETAISKIISNESEEELILRGHRLSDLIRTASFAQAVFLMLSGRMPTPGQARTLDAVFTACVDHAVTPAAMIGRAFASYGTSIPAAIAGGILMFGDITGGAGDPLARLMTQALARPAEGAPDADDARVQAAARQLVAQALAAGGRMPGFGIPRTPGIRGRLRCCTSPRRPGPPDSTAGCWWRSRPNSHGSKAVRSRSTSMASWPPWSWTSACPKVAQPPS